MDPNLSTRARARKLPSITAAAGSQAESPARGSPQYRSPRRDPLRGAKEEKLRYPRGARRVHHFEKSILDVALKNQKTQQHDNNAIFQQAPLLRAASHDSSQHENFSTQELLATGLKGALVGPVMGPFVNKKLFF